MSARLTGWVAVVIVAAAVVLDGVAVSLFVRLADRPAVLELLDPSLFVWQLLVVGPFVVVGALVATRRPSHVTGWLLLATGLLVAMAVASQAYVVWAVFEMPTLGGESAALVVGAGAWVCVQAVVAPWLVLSFPDGKLPSRSWRAILLLQAAVLAAVAVLLLTPGDFGTRTGVANPFGIELLRRLGRGPVWLFEQMVNVFMAVCCVSLVFRFRRSRGQERLQLKWIGWAAALAAVSLVGYSVIAPLAPATLPLWYALGGVGGLLIAVATGVAVTRYRLYEIDRIISRTISWAIVSAIVVAAYAGMVVSLQGLLAEVTQGQTLAVAASTLLVAASFNPLRTRLQHAVDRRFNRTGHDHAQILAAFSAGLRAEMDVDRMMENLAATLRIAVAPSTLTTWHARRPPPGSLSARETPGVGGGMGARDGGPRKPGTTTLPPIRPAAPAT